MLNSGAKERYHHGRIFWLDSSGETLCHYKITGFPVAETGKVGQTRVNLESLNLKRLLLQQLRSYEASGLSSLPVGSGELPFDLSDLMSDGGAESAEASQQGTTAVVGTAAAAQRQSAQGVGTSLQSSTPNASTTGAPSSPQPVAQSSSNPGGTGSANVSPDDSVPGSELTLPYPQSLPLAQRQQQLTVLQSLVSECTRCEELANSRTQTVFGVGDPTARLVFVGEGPGADEDRQGEPFVGAAGQLLNKILDACQLSREQVYILNVVKCRPPRNRNPSDSERSCCWGYAREQLEILQPEFICCLGSVAAKSLLNTKQPLGRMRQQFHAYRGSRVIVTYHPAYLLRTPSAKRHVWDDMKLLMKAMGVDL